MDGRIDVMLRFLCLALFLTILTPKGAVMAADLENTTRVLTKLNDSIFVLLCSYKMQV